MTTIFATPPPILMTRRLRQLALFDLPDGHGHASLVGRRTTYVARCQCGKPAHGPTKRIALNRLTAHLRSVRGR